MTCVGESVTKTTIDVISAGCYLIASKCTFSHNFDKLFSLFKNEWLAIVLFSSRKIIYSRFLLWLQAII